MSKTVEEIDQVVIKFAGDSGDGMQLTGTQFSNTAAFIGNDLATFPDFPAEIRAPQGTVAGVSGFKIQFGSNRIFSPGDEADILIAMNPAALLANIDWIKDRGTIIIDSDNFKTKDFEKAGYEKCISHKELRGKNYHPSRKENVNAKAHYLRHYQNGV